MEIITRNPVWTDSDYFLYASGRRKKKRYGLNKAVGYIPTVAAVRYFKDRSDENKRLDRQAAVMERRRQEQRRGESPSQRSESSAESPTPRRRRPAPRRRRPAPKRRPVSPRSGKSTSAMPPRPSSRPPRPRPEGKPNTSNQPLDKPAETTQSFLKNKAVMIGLGVLVVGVIGYFIFKSSKANK